MKTDEIELACNHFIEFDVSLFIFKLYLINFHLVQGKQNFKLEKINSTISNNCVSTVPITTCESLPKDYLFFKSSYYASRNEIVNN